jgi:hypothetical protein
MRRGIAVIWQVVSFLIAAVLYFFFVLPRWPELMGDTPHALGTVVRIVTGVLIGLTALPVVLTLRKTRRPEFGTPQLALSLRVWSIVGHIAAGVLIVVTAIAEIWLDLDTYGRWLFAVYGAAAAVALLGAAAFYLAFAAELPPPPPKPLKPKKDKPQRGRKAVAVESAVSTAVADETESDVDSAEQTVETDAPADAVPEPATVSAQNGAALQESGTVVDETSTAEEAPAIEDEPVRHLRNRRRTASQR